MRNAIVRGVGIGGVVALGFLSVPALASAEGKRVDAVVMPPASVSVIEARGPRVVWLDFEGGSLRASANIDDSRSDTSFILSEGHAPGVVVNVPPFDENELSDPQSMNRAQIIAYVKAEMETIHLPYDISFVLTRPASGNYQRLIFGGTCAGISGGTSCAGIAVRDCLDSNLNNVGYAHPPGLTVDQLVTTAAQEMAHAYGLNHTEDTGDIMFPQLQPGFDPRSYGSGTVPVTESACGGAVAQDSHALLLANIGPRGQDVTAPLISIDSPAANGLDDDGAVTIAVTASDEEVLVSVECSVDGTTAGTLNAAPFEFDVTGLDIGSHTAACVATDDSGNIGMDSVRFFVGDCVTSGDCAGDLICEDNICVDPPPPGSNGEIGDDCNADRDCDSDRCVTIGAFSRCSQDCTGDGECPAGLECRSGENVCWAPEDDGGGSSGSGDGDGGPLGCLSSSVAGNTGTAPGLAFLVALVVLGLVRRRS